MMQTITAAQAKAMLMAVARRMVECKEDLCEADRYIGDGDHGIGMANGFEAAQKELGSQEFDDVYKVFFTVGRTMIKVMGGASGIIFGSLFYAGSKNMEPRAEIGTKEFSMIFEKALDDIKVKGQARVGDKTVVDGLEPAVEAMIQCTSQQAGLEELLRSACVAAEEGKENSKQYIARFGKAKTLGERAIGYPDAGTVSLAVIMHAMLDWVKEQ